MVASMVFLAGLPKDHRKIYPLRLDNSLWFFLCPETIVGPSMRSIQLSSSRIAAATVTTILLACGASGSS